MKREKGVTRVFTWIVVVILLMCILGGCGTIAKTTDTKEKKQEIKAEISVFIAASLRNAMEEIRIMYKSQNPNVTITYNADSSGTLQTQIEEGAACDIFFSAATKQMKALSEAGLVEESSVINLLHNDVVLIKPAGGNTQVTGFEDITKAANIALAGEEVPVGAYAREIFKNFGILDDVLEMEINEGANVTAVLAAVSEMSNEIGVVYATDAASVADSVQVMDIAPEGSLDSPAIYPVGQIVNTEASEEETKATKAFLKYLTTDEVGKVFEEYGFKMN